MLRALLLAVAMVLTAAGFSQAQAEPVGKKPADPRDELRYDGKPFAYWESFGRNELKAERRVEAIRALAAFGSRGYAREAAVPIVEMLKEYDNAKGAFGNTTATPDAKTPDQRVVSEILWALGKIGADGSPVVVANLDRKAVAEAAQELYLSRTYFPEPISVEAVPVLVRSMESKNAEIRKLAIQILGNAVRYQEDPESRERLASAFRAALEKGKSEKAIIDALTKSESGEAVRLLGALGTRAKSATGMLVRLELNDESADAQDALAAIKPTVEQRVAGIMQVIKDDDDWPTPRIRAAAKLVELSPAARPALPDLLKEINRPAPDLSKYYHGATKFWEVRVAVVESYVKIAGAKEALPTVVEMLEKNQFPQIEREVVQIFLKLENDPERVVPVLAKSLDRLTAAMKKRSPTSDTQDRFLTELVGGLGAQGKHAGSAVPLLIESYDLTYYNENRLNVVTVIGKIGPPAKDALPFLSKLLEAENMQMRHAAAEAIQAITKKK
jgi:phage head maturation protease